MIGLFPLAITLLPAAAGATRTVFDWGRLDSPVDLVLPLVALAATVAFVILMYVLDSRELHPVVAVLLTVLRVVAFTGLLILYLQPQWRTEREVVENSRVLVLVDTSSSMGLGDGAGPNAAGSMSRSQAVASSLDQTGFLTRLRKDHDVAVVTFDEDLKRVAALSKQTPEDKPAAPPPASGAPAPAEAAPIDWPKALAPTGRETRLGQALRQALLDERDRPLAGIVLVTDGGQNAGPAPEPAVQLAKQGRVPIFAVGVGSDRRPVNVRVDRLEVLARVYKGDPYKVTGLVRAQQLEGRTVTVDLLERQPAAGPSKPGTGTVVESQQVILSGDQQAVPVEFQLTPAEVGRRTLCLRVVAPAGDHNPDDNLREADVEVVDRKDRVLLVAGGPSREYQFVRGLLFRDQSMTVDVWLQTAQPGMSQEANEILDDFPATREEMAEYDSVVAFDPDWKAMSAGQIDLLEAWVAEQAGGLVVVAGPIHMGESVSGWTQDPAMAKIRAVYPVELLRQVTVTESVTHTSADPWPLDFTREGMEAQFLWLADTATESQQTWAEFPGVFSCQPVRGPKPGATVLARFSDPTAGRGGEPLVYMAEQFYGAGRVVYLGSAELYRLRRLGDEPFERLYTRMIRHAAQGRLLRQSGRGLLMVGQDEYVLGNSIEIRAQLTNPQLAPLDAPSVNLEVFLPGGAVRTVSLRADPTRPGTFAGQLPAAVEGTYRLELPIPDSGDERLTRRVQVRLPDLERQRPERNDALLTQIADESGGKYYPDLQAALGPTARDPVAARLKDRTRTSIQPVGMDLRWERVWMGWWLAAVCGVLCVEWLIRRLSKLA